MTGGETEGWSRWYRKWWELDAFILLLFCLCFFFFFFLRQNLMYPRLVLNLPYSQGWLWTSEPSALASQRLELHNKLPYLFLCSVLLYVWHVCVVCMCIVCVCVWMVHVLCIRDVSGVWCVCYVCVYVCGVWDEAQSLEETLKKVLSLVRSSDWVAWVKIPNPKSLSSYIPWFRGLGQ